MEERWIESRLTELETKVSYQDHLIGELNDVVVRQQQQIDQLEKQMMRFSEHLKQASDSGLARPDEEVPPRHY